MFSLSLPGRTAVAVLPLILALAGCRGANSYLAKGDAKFAQGQFDAASLNYRKAAQKDPNLGEAHHGAGLAELKQNKVAEALQDLQQAARLLPDNQAAKTDLANLLLGAYIGDSHRPKFLYDLLVQFSGEWLKSNPNSMQGLRIKGYLAMLDQRPDEAVSILRHAHQLYPEDQKIVEGLMDAFFRNNQPAEAEKAALGYLAANKTAADVYDALYRMYIAARRGADAENILIRKASAIPNSGGYILQLAGYYAAAGKKPEMAQTLEKFLSNPGADSKVHLEAGDFYAAVGDLPNALHQYYAGLANHKSDQLPYKNRIARVLLLQNKRAEGLKILNETVAQYPEDAEARSLRAALLVGAPGTAKAGEGIQELRTVVEKNPSDVFLKFVFARGLIENGNPAEARSQLLQVVRLRPQFVEAHVMLADIAFKQSDMTETIQQAEAALEVDSQNLRARMLRGSALLQQGSLDQAGSVLGALARQVPQSMDVQLQLAYLPLKRRDYAQAEAAFNKILAAHPTEWRALAGLVDTDLAQDHPEKALSRLEAQLTRSHGSPAVRYLLATTALRSGKYNTAIENFRELGNQTPDSIGPELEMANVFRLKGDVHNAVLTLQKAAVLQPKDPRPAALLPFLLEMENRSQEAKQVVRQELVRHPLDPDAMNNLAFLLAQTGDNLDEALKLARQAVSKAPNNPAYQDTLGYVYLKRDQNDEGLDIFSRLNRKYPDDPACAYHTAMAWYQKGDRARAKTLLAHALELNPPKDIESGAHDLLSRVN
jgi:tetratricopeptide (TPR) repeat protein